MHHRTSALLGFLVIVAALAYPLVAVVLGHQVDGYSHFRDHISELGVAELPNSWVLNAVLIANAVLVALVARALRVTLPAAADHPWGPRLVGLFGIALLVGGLFPCDENCEPTSVAGLLHVVNLLPSAIASIGAPFAMAGLFARSGHPGFAATASTLGGLTVVAIVAAFAVFPALDLIGLGQRVVLATQLGFFVLLGASIVYLEGGWAALAPATPQP